MPYRRFLLFNVVGGIAWGTTFVLLGYAAGSSWRRVEKIAGQASLVLLVVIVVGLLIRWGTRRLATRADAVRNAMGRLAETRMLQWVQTSFATPLHWLGARTRPGASYGLGWTLSLLIAGAAAWVVGIAVQDLFAKDELALLDRPVADWIAAHTTAPLVSTAEFVVDLFTPPVGLWVVIVLALVGWRLAGKISGMRVLLAGLLASGAAIALQRILPTSVTGTLFPSAAVTALAAGFVAFLPAVVTRSFAAAIRVAGSLRCS